MSLLILFHPTKNITNLYNKFKNQVKDKNNPIFRLLDINNAIKYNHYANIPNSDTIYEIYFKAIYKEIFHFNYFNLCRFTLNWTNLQLLNIAKEDIKYFGYLRNSFQC